MAYVDLCFVPAIKHYEDPESLDFNEFVEGQEARNAIVTESIDRQIESLRTMQNFNVETSTTGFYWRSGQTST